MIIKNTINYVETFDFMKEIFFYMLFLRIFYFYTQIILKIYKHMTTEFYFKN